nr:transposase (putative), gypsy type [Tanacetum cinerariifolium]
MSFSKRPGKNTPHCYTKPHDSLKNWSNQFFWVDGRIFPTVEEWRTNAPKDKIPSADSYSAGDVTILTTRRTPIQKLPKALLCLVGLSRRYFLEDDVYPTFHYDDDRDIDLFSLISPLNPTKVKTGTRPRATHEVPLLTATASPVIDMEDTAVASGSSGTPSALEKSPLDFANEDSSPNDYREGRDRTRPRRIGTRYPTCRKGNNDGVRSRTKPKEGKYPRREIPSSNRVRCGLHRLHACYIGRSYRCERSRSAIICETAIAPERDIAQSSRKTANEIPSGNVATTEVRDGSPGGIYQPGWGVANNCYLDTPNAYQDMVDHILPPRVVEVEVHGLCNQTKNLETLLEAEVDIKNVVKAKNGELAKELESLRVQFSDLQVSNIQLSQQVSNLQAQVTSKEKIKAAFEEFKRYEDDRVEQRCAKMDARLDKLSVDFDEELYPHMLTAIADRHWTRHAPGRLKHGIEHERVGRDLAAIEAYDPEADSKYVKALQDLKDLKYPLVDQLEKLKDAPMNLIMASLYLESDTEEDAPQWIRDLCPRSSQLKILIYPDVCDLEDPWAFKEEVLLEDAIAANRSRAEKKKKCRVVCRTHEVGSTYHARSNGILVFVPTVAPRGVTPPKMCVAAEYCTGRYFIILQHMLPENDL